MSAAARRSWVTGLVATIAGLAVACADDGAAPIEVVRQEDHLTVRGPDLALVARLAADRTALRCRLGDGGPDFALAPGPLGWSAPSGAIGPLSLSTGSAGEPAWIAQLDGVDYRLWRDDDRAALAQALAPTALGGELAAALPYHRHARAWMAETRALFAIAALAVAGTDDDPRSWPIVETDLDRDPPGLRPGDRPGLGMTCSTEIRCPGDAPICVTESHEQVHGFCTRACLDDRECDDGGGGRCGLAITDVPGVSAGLTGCYLPCGGAVADCPALLACHATYADQPASICAPP